MGYSTEYSLENIEIEAVCIYLYTSAINFHGLNASLPLQDQPSISCKMKV